jgi:Ca-activated chloride channel family protein
MSMSLALRTWVDRVSVRPDVDAKLHLVVEIEASGDPVEGPRPPGATILALDVSGSMQGTPIDQVVRSVDLILDALRPNDRVGVVAFSDDATTVVDPVVLDAAGKRLIRSRVARIPANGHTNIEAGLELASRMLPTDASRRCVVLLSDGSPNLGAATPDTLRDVVRKHRPHVTFASLGYGQQHDEDVLAAIGDAGGGGYELVPDPTTCARAFARALGAQGDVVADAIELVVSPGHGVEIVRFLGREETRFGREGVVVSLADMVPGTRRVVVCEIAIAKPGAARFLADVARLSLGWKRPGTTEKKSIEEKLTVEIADRDPAIVAEAASRVMLVRADVVRDDARAAADRGAFASAATILRALLAEIDRVPGFVQGDGSPLAEAYELLVDEATAMERRPTAEAYRAFRKTTVASRLAAPAPPSSSHGPASSRLLDMTAGNFPEAYLVVDGGRHRLGAECVIGRTASADLPIVSASISRRHAEVFALEGEFWACDLGSTNPTQLNGKSLGSKPEKLANGDVLRVGDIEIRYEEKPKP